MLQYIFQLYNTSIDFNSNDINLLFSSHFAIKNISFVPENNQVIIAAKKLDPDFTLTILNTAGYEAAFIEKIPLFFSKIKVFSAILSIIIFIFCLLLYFSDSEKLFLSTNVMQLFRTEFIPYSQLTLALITMLLNYYYYAHSFKSLFKKSLSPDLPIAVSTCSLFLFSCYQLFMQSYDKLYFMPLITILVLSTTLRLIADIIKKEFFRTAEYPIGNLPATACRLDLDSDEEKTIPIAELQKDDILIIKPGNILPADGEISWGTAQLDESIVTGDSLLKDKSINDLVYAQTKNTKGTFQYRVTSTNSDTLLYRLRQISYNALINSAAVSPSINKLSKLLIIFSLLAACIAASYWSFAGEKLSFIITIFAAVIIIICPYNVILAKNLLLNAAIIKCARRGIFIKDASALNNLCNTDTLILGKSGIITTGQSKVIALHAEGLLPKSLLALAASAEYGNEHHLASAVVNSAIKNKVHTQRISSSQLIAGNGVEAIINREIIRVGKAAWLEAEGINISPELKDKAYQAARDGLTPIFIALDKYCHGVLIIENPLRNELPHELHSLNKINIILFTGDNNHTTKALAKKLGINQFRSELSLSDKAKEIALLHTRGLTIAFVSNKASDIEALQAADIGILFNNKKPNDTAIAAADIICLNDNFSSLCHIITFARKSIKSMKQNILLALLMSIIGGIIAAGGIYHWISISLSPITAACLCAIINILIMGRTIFTTLIFNK